MSAPSAPLLRPRAQSQKRKTYIKSKFHYSNCLLVSYFAEQGTWGKKFLIKHHPSRRIQNSVYTKQQCRCIQTSAYIEQQCRCYLSPRNSAFSNSLMHDRNVSNCITRITYRCHHYHQHVWVREVFPSDLPVIQMCETSRQIRAETYLHLNYCR